MHFSLSINHVALQLSTHGINDLCCFRERRSAKLNQEIFFCLCFILDFSSQKEITVLEVSFVEREKHYFYSKTTFVHIKNRIQGSKHRVLA